MKRIFIIVVSITTFACSKGEYCSIDPNEIQLQQFETQNEIFYLSVTNDGSFGSHATLRACEKERNELVEKIDLRSEDFKPKIDSVVEKTIFISYYYPRFKTDKPIEKLEFESVVLGDALFHKDQLQYKYEFFNLNNKHEFTTEND